MIWGSGWNRIEVRTKDNSFSDTKSKMLMLTLQ